MMGPVNGIVSDGMPSMRRRRAHLSSVQTNQIEVHGNTYLCFSVDHSWFQGNINTDDESSYSLYGERVSPNPEIPIVQNNKVKINEEENNNNESPADENKRKSSDALNIGQEYYNYRVTLTDHFTGLSHHLPKIGVNPRSIPVNGNTGTEQAEDKDNLFICNDAEVKFRVDNIFKGQKADMVIQKCLGSSSLLGQKCLVYAGPISILFNEVIETGRNWCL